MKLRRVLKVAIAAGVAGLASACTDAAAPDQRRVSQFLSVSEPVTVGLPSTSALSASVEVRAAMVTGVETIVAFVSIPVGTVPDGDSIVVINQRSGEKRSARLIAGGLDPLPIPAIVGDTLDVTLTYTTGARERVFLVVPLRRSPRVVRTRPGVAIVDVPLNMRITVVFSEPMDPRTLSSPDFTLTLNGLPVAGEISVDADRLTGHFTPAEMLTPSTEYVFIATVGVLDQGGDRLDEPLQLRFTTVSGGGKAVLFVSARDGNSEIYSVRPDGTGLVNLTHNPTRDFDPAWSADGKRIAFVRAGAGGLKDLYVMNADGTGASRVTQLDEDLGNVSWSPDGLRLAFARVVSITSTTIRMCINTVRLDGSGLAAVVCENAAFLQNPSWSPDGSRIAFDRTQLDPITGQLLVLPDIYVVRVDGTGVTRLTTNSGHDMFPAWSPDGQRIGFTSAQPEGAGLYVMNADGSGITRLISTSGSRISWSPDGKRISFTSSYEGNDEIYVANVDGSGITNVSNGIGADDSPSWSRK